MLKLLLQIPCLLAVANAIGNMANTGNKIFNPPLRLVFYA